MAPILAVRQWLQYVNDQVSPEGVEYLKLALHPFLVANYQEAERLMIPSKLYDFLLEKHFQDDVETTLRWFVHALSLLGGDLRGHRLVEHLHTYGISRPSDPENMTRDQRFFECLTKIGRKARGLKLEVKLIHSFSRSAVLNIHYKNVNGLPDIFVKLVRTQKVSTTDTDLLAATLRKYGAKQCLFYLNEYHKAVGMKEIPGMTNFSRGRY